MSAPTAAASPALGRRHPAAAAEYEDNDDDLTSFRQVCHRLYYDKDPTSARQVDQVLSRLPAQDRTMYARIMADVRSAYHRDEEIRRRAQVEHLLAEVEPASIVKSAIGVSAQHSDPSVAAMRSPQARRLRADRFEAFLSTNCHEANIMPGPHPFLRGLYAMLWLQTRGDRNRCVEWTVDVAVLTEAGSGETWSRDAVELLKGVSWRLLLFSLSSRAIGLLVDTAALIQVLGMSERIQAPQVASTYADSTYTSRLSAAFSDLSSSAAAPPPGETFQPSRQPVSRFNSTRAPVAFERPSGGGGGGGGGGGEGPPPPVPPHRGSTLRTRAPSDPFLDDKAPLVEGKHEQEELEVCSTVVPPSSSLAVSSSLDPLGSDPDLASPTTSTPFLPKSTTASAFTGISARYPHIPIQSPSPRPSTAPPSSSSLAALGRSRPPPPSPRATLPGPAVPPQFRTFTLPPYLTNPELYALLRLFPSFIAAPVRRAVSSSSMTTTIDEWEEKLSAVIHGEVALAPDEGEGGGTTVRRSEGWKGTLWERFLLWLRRLFGLM